MKTDKLLKIILFFILISSPVFGQMEGKTATITSTIETDYLLYLPESYQENKEKSFPLVLFLHGGGESGNDLEMVKKHGPPMLIAEGKEFPFIMVAPQNPHQKGFWDDTMLFNLLNKIIEDNRVDKNKIYLMGLSRGGYGAWRLAIQHPEIFTALVVISGEAPASYSNWLGNMPIWVFHGKDDPVIPARESKQMVENLKKNGNPVKFTLYKKTGHDAWTKTFENPELYDWLLNQKKN